MIEISMDASQLEVFEPCPRKWYYAYNQNLIPLRSKRVFDVGSYYHSCLAHYYYLFPPLGTVLSLDDRLLSTINYCTQSALLTKYHIVDVEEQKFHRQRLLDYLMHWSTEDETMVPCAIEQGFSYLLYEDKYKRYILEGKIDLIAKLQPYGLIVMDHKTQSRKDDIWELNHQVMNYLNYMRVTATEADYFVYNYIGLQDKIPKEGMRRSIYKPHPNMLIQWSKEVIKTFDDMFEILSITGDNFRELSFNRHRSACSSKYGLCQFYKLCSVPDHSKWNDSVLSHYRIRDEKWRAWT